MDFSYARGPKYVTIEQQDHKMVQMTLTPKPMVRQQIADKMGIKGDMVSRVTVGNRLKAHGLRFNKRLKNSLYENHH